MALIERLETDDWSDNLRMNFTLALDSLKTDRFRSVSSAVDDLRSWLAVGGIGRVKHHLSNQMEMRCFPPRRQAEIQALVDQLAREHQRDIVSLMAHGIIPPTKRDWLLVCGMTESECDDLWEQAMAGEKPFEDRMHAHGRSDEEIAAVYRVIDQWLRQQGVVPPPSAEPKLN